MSQDTRATRRAFALDAARAVLVDGGGEKLSMRRLANASGTAINTLYAMFGTREGILDAIVDDALTGYIELMARSPEISTSPTEQLSWMMETSTAYITGHPERSKSMYRAADELRATHRIAQPIADTIFDPLLTRAVEVGELRDDTITRHAATWAASALTDLSLSWSHDTIVDDHLRAGCRYGLAMVLCAHASPEHAARLQARLAQAAEALSRFG